MRDEFEDKLGQQIRKDILREASEIDIPPVNEQWKDFLQRYGLHTKRTNRLRKAFIAAAALLLLVISVSLIKPSTASALGERVYNSIRIFLGGSLYNINTVPKENSSPPVVQRNDFSSEKEMSLDKVQKIVFFSVAKPHYLPQGTKLKRVLLSQGGDIYSIKMEYSLQNQPLILIQNNVVANHSGSLLYDSDDAKVDRMDINGSEGYLLKMKDGSLIIRWVIRGLELELISKMEEAELIKVAQSIS